MPYDASEPGHPDNPRSSYDEEAALSEMVPPVGELTSDLRESEIQTLHSWMIANIDSHDDVRMAMVNKFRDMALRSLVPSEIAPPSSPVEEGATVLVPIIKYAELLECLEDMSKGRGGWAWENVLEEHHDILASANASHMKGGR